jgi:hypothetical protein
MKGNLMDPITILQQLKGHITVTTVIIALLLLGSEKLGADSRIKASSYVDVFKALAATLKDQIWPKALAAAETPVTTPAESPKA